MITNNISARTAHLSSMSENSLPRFGFIPMDFPFGPISENTKKNTDKTKIGPVSPPPVPPSIGNALMSLGNKLKSIGL